MTRFTSAMLHRFHEGLRESHSAFDWEIVRVPLLAGSSIGVTSVNLLDWTLKTVVSVLTIIYLVRKIRATRKPKSGGSDSED